MRQFRHPLQVHILPAKCTDSKAVVPAPADYTNLGSFGDAEQFGNNMVAQMDRSFMNRSPWKPKQPVQVGQCTAQDSGLGGIKFPSVPDWGAVVSALLHNRSPRASHCPAQQNSVALQAKLMTCFK